MPCWTKAEARAVGQRPNCDARDRCHEVVAITAVSNKLRRTRGNTRRDDHTFGLFVIEKKADDGRWSACSTRRTARAALDCAWDLLTREDGEVRIRKGLHVVASGMGRAALGSSEQPAKAARCRRQKFASSKKRW